MFALIDIILISVVILFFIAGLFYGFIHTVGNLIGLVGGIWLSSFLVSQVQESFQLANNPVAATGLFVVAMLFSAWIFGKLVDLFDGMFNFIAIIPFLKSINKLLGGVFGLVSGLVLLTALHLFASTYLMNLGLGKTLLNTRVMTWIDPLASFSQWLIF